MAEMGGTCSSWLPGSPFLSPAWRWMRARWWYEHGKRVSRRIDDDWVARAKRFLAACGTGTPRPAPRRTRCQDAAVQAAFDLVDDPHPRQRWEVEALLLTGE